MVEPSFYMGANTLDSPSSLGSDRWMRIHVLNCCSFKSLGGRRLLGVAGGVTRVLLVETPQALVLVDSGIGLADVSAPRRLGRTFGLTMRPRLHPDECATRQVQALGYSPRDVRHIVLTHLDVDHTGGLSDFPWAQVHVMEAELVAARGPRQFRRQPMHWDHAPTFNTYGAAGEDWRGLGGVQRLVGLPPELLLVPLPGHSPGHAGVALETGEGVLLHGGDAWFYRGELESPPVAPKGMELLQRALAWDWNQRNESLARVRGLLLAHPDVHALCAHDPAPLPPPLVA